MLYLDASLGGLKLLDLDELLMFQIAMDKLFHVFVQMCTHKLTKRSRKGVHTTCLLVNNK